MSEISGNDVPFLVLLQVENSHTVMITGSVQHVVQMAA